MATIFLAFYIWGAHWRHLTNTTEPSMCSGDAALCQITLTTCYDLMIKLDVIKWSCRLYSILFMILICKVLGHGIWV